MTSSRPGLVSVIVPHYQDLSGLAVCLAALDRQTFPRNRFELVIGDNGSPCGLEAVQQVVAGRGRVVLQPQKGAGPARNAAIAASTGEMLAFTDADCIPGEDWLRAGVERLGSADLVGGRMLVSVGDERRMSGAEAFERVFAFDNRTYIEEKRFSVSANLFCRRAVFDAVGPFHTGVPEDLDWCHRAVASGFRLVYEPGAEVTHPARRDWPALQRKWRRMNGEHFRLEFHPGGRLRWTARQLALPASIFAHAPAVVTSRDLPDARARLLALATLARLRLWRMGDSLGYLFGKTAS